MSLHKDLLDQARFLVRRETRRPKQASLRRAISAAYYAVFHLLVEEASAFFIRGANRRPLRNSFGRAFQHGEMKQAAAAFQGSNPPRWLQGQAIPQELKNLCSAFVELQQSRHEADYDRNRVFTRKEAEDLVSLAESALTNWGGIATTPAAEAFLVSLLVHQRLRS